MAPTRPERIERLSPLNSTPLLAAVVLLATAALYIRTAGPTLGGAFDSEEFQHAAFTLAVAHSTGYPFYLLIGKLFTTLVPLGSVAFRMNLLSALLGAGTAALVFLNAWILTRRRLAALTAAAVFATNTAVWRQAGVASVSPLTLLLFAAILYALLLWHAGRISLAPAAFAFGLGLSHHRATVLLAPAILLFILMDDPTIVRRPREWLRCAIWVVLPLLLYLYLPLFGSNSPWYTNTLAGFFAEVSGAEISGYLRATVPDILQGVVLETQYLADSFGILGLLLVIAGAVAQWPRGASIDQARRADSARTHHVMLLLGLSTIPFAVFGTLYAGEPDRYLVLPFVFLIYWFALGIAAVQDWLSARTPLPAPVDTRTPLPADAPRRAVASLGQPALALALALLVLLPFPNRFQTADWSTFDRVYKQWDEIFTLPIPRGAVLVGNWGQLNAMRYMQRVEGRRPDLQFVGTLYDPAPQTQAAQAAFESGRSLFLSPGIALPTGTYRYALLGPLVQVQQAPRLDPPTVAVTANVAVNAGLKLAGYDVATALEPFSPTTGIAPGRTARVTLVWQATGPTSDFDVRIGLYDPEGRLVAQRDEPPVRDLYPVSAWQTGEYVVDVHNFLIPAGTPPGTYRWRAGVVDAATKKPLGDQIAGGSLTLLRITTLTSDQVFRQHPLDVTLGHGVALIGYGGLGESGRAGEKQTINLIWRVEGAVGDNLTLDFAWVDPAGKTAAEWQVAPLAYYPSGEWQRGEILKGYFDVPLPDAAGSWVLTVGLDPTTRIPLATAQIAP